MIAAVAIPVPSLTTVRAGRVTNVPLQVVRTCDGCGKSTFNPDALFCSHAACPLRSADLGAANDAIV